MLTILFCFLFSAASSIVVTGIYLAVFDLNKKIDKKQAIMSNLIFFAIILTVTILIARL